MRFWFVLSAAASLVAALFGVTLYLSATSAPQQAVAAAAACAIAIVPYVFARSVQAFFTPTSKELWSMVRDLKQTLPTQQ